MSLPVLVLLWLLWQPAAAPAGAGPYNLPFDIGEVISYDVRWQQIPAGSSKISVLPYTDVNEQKAFHFKLEVKTNDFLDKLYKVRDVMEGFVAYDLSGSVLYKRNSAGKRKKDILVRFFPEKNQVVYSNFGGKRDPVDILNHTFDPVSSFYCLRALPLEVGKTISFPVTDGKKCFLQKGDVVGKETITTPAGEFDTFVVTPYTTHFSGVFQKSDNPSVRVWISADDKRIPVRIKIGVTIGSIIFDLTCVEQQPIDTRVSAL